MYLGQHEDDDGYVVYVKLGEDSLSERF
jgi:hypothetical protein